MVASFAEAWIEIYFFLRLQNRPLVASFAEAWIEIFVELGTLVATFVASFAEAWIEIRNKAVNSVENMSLPSRKRGLK